MTGYRFVRSVPASSAARGFSNEAGADGEEKEFVGIGCEMIERGGFSNKTLMIM